MPLADQSFLLPLWLIVGIISKYLEKMRLVLGGFCLTLSYGLTNKQSICICYYVKQLSRKFSAALRCIITDFVYFWRKTMTENRTVELTKE